MLLTKPVHIKQQLENYFIYQLRHPPLTQPSQLTTSVSKSQFASAIQQLSPPTRSTDRLTLILQQILQLPAEDSLIPHTPKYEQLCDLLNNLFLRSSSNGNRYSQHSMTLARHKKTMASGSILSFEKSNSLGSPSKTSVLRSTKHCICTTLMLTYSY